MTVDALTSLLFRCPETALILEEIAIDCHNKETEERLLQEAHDLHLSSLQLAKKAFGEFNVQTAKHYGNLGRLYQSMRKFKVNAVCVHGCIRVYGRGYTTLLNCSVISGTVALISNHFLLIKLKNMDANFEASKTK